jgi:energy-coupling factor transporter ATP-binding protein EcfA2
MSQVKSGECITIVGKRGSGKSYLAREIGKAMPKQVIFDPVNDWSEGVIVRSFAQFCEKVQLFNSAEHGNLIFRFDPDDNHRAETLNEALRVIYHMGDVQVVIDEIQLFTSPHYMPPYLENLYFIGRHKKVGVTAITQRPSKLNKSCLAQSEHVFVGQLHENNDIKVVSSFLNMSHTDIASLKPREFQYYSPTYGSNRFSTELIKNSENNKIKSELIKKNKNKSK